MGETAENIAQMMPEITRQQQDEFALASHQRAIAAIDSGKFAQEIIPVSIPQKKGDPILVDTDERPRRDTNPRVAFSLATCLSKRRHANRRQLVRIE